MDDGTGELVIVDVAGGSNIYRLGFSGFGYKTKIGEKGTSDMGDRVEEDAIAPRRFSGRGQVAKGKQIKTVVQQQVDDVLRGEWRLGHVHVLIEGSSP